jgi:L-aminopeptidase/D-esterase-like protein
MSDIKLPEGIFIGHADDGEKTGVTVILAPAGAVGGADVRGCAPGTRETDLLRPEKSISLVNAVAFCGGSAFGLAACDGIVRYCREKSIGHAVGAVKVPLVAGAVIFDLHDASYAHPDAQSGYCACIGAKNHGLEWGRVGAGTGAAVGKILGPGCSEKGGIGAATVSAGEAFVTAVTAVNALGDIIDPKTGKIIRGTRMQGKHINTAEFIMSGKRAALMKGANTTLSCIITNVKLTKLEANKLASIAHDGFARAISPVHTDYDGDTIFALSKGEISFDFTALSVMAAEAVVQSILHAVK